MDNASASPTTGFDNRISLQKLEVLCLVVELGGIGRAAEHLNVSQPVVTAHMRTLQERVRAKLLYRDGQQMRLTETGETVYAWAREVLAGSREVSRRVEDLAGGAAGTAVVASSMSVGSYMLPGILSDFMRERPSASITLHVSDAEDAIAAVEVGEADVALVTSAADLDQSSLGTEHVCDHELILVASPEDRHAGDAVTLEELSALRFVCSPRGRPRRRLIDEALGGIGLGERRIVIQLGHPEALKIATARGLGVCLMLAASVTQELEAGILRRVEIEGATLSVPIRLARRTDKRFTALQDVLLADVREALPRRFGLTLPAAS